MLNWFVDYLIRRAAKTPYFDLPGYMRRTWLVPYRTPQVRMKTASLMTRDGTGPVCWWTRPIAWVLQRLGIAVRVHEILRSDRGRWPHNHPWSFVAVILKGGYREHRFDSNGEWISSRWYRPGSILYRPAGSWHLLEVPPGKTATTLFITGPKRQSWGFHVAGRFVGWRDHKEEQ